MKNWRRILARILATIMMVTTLSNAFTNAFAADDDAVIEPAEQTVEAETADAEGESQAEEDRTATDPATELVVTEEEVPPVTGQTPDETKEEQQIMTDQVNEEGLTADDETSEEEEVETDVPVTFETQSVRVGETLITVSYQSDAFATPVTLHATQITAASNAYAQVEAAVGQAAASDDTLSTDDFAAFDIYFTDADGQEAEPAAGAYVSVSISTTGKETPASDNVAEVLHITDNNRVEIMNADTDGGSADFTTDSFSIYIVVGGVTKTSKDYTAGAGLYRRGNGAITINDNGYVSAGTAEVTFTAGDGTGASYQVHGHDTIYGVYYHEGGGVYHKVKVFRLANTDTDNWRVFATFEDGYEEVTYYNNGTGESNVIHFAWLIEPMDSRVITAKVYLKYDNLVPDDSSSGNLLHGGVAVAKFGPYGNNEPYFTVNVDLAKLEELGGVLYKNAYGHSYYTYLSSGLGNKAGDADKAQTFFYNYLLPSMEEGDEAKFAGRFGRRKNGDLNYVGYVLKLETDGWHLDGIAVDAPSFLVELYDLEKTNTPFDTIPSLERRPYTEAKAKFRDYFYTRFKDVTLVEWTDAAQLYEGNITLADGTMYKFKVTTKDSASGVDADGIITYGEITPTNIFWLARFFVEFEKVPTGSLTLTKKLTGDLNDEIRNTEYTFRVTDKDGKTLRFKKASDGTYQRAGSDGSETISVKGEGSVTLTGLPAGNYTVTENSFTAPLNYTATTIPAGKAVTVTVVANSTREAIITNNFKADTISIDVEKRWADENNKDGLRPDSVTVKLMNGNTEVRSATLNASNNWKQTFANLPKVDANGKDINYTVQEVSVEHYTSSVSGSMANGYVITNTHEVKTISIKVKKTWDDNDNEAGLRPESITVQLIHRLNDGLGWRDASRTVVLSKSNNWEDSFDNLPMYANKQLIGYRIREVSVSPYTTTYTPDVSKHDIEITAETADKTITITNTYNPTYTDVPVEKKWEDEEDVAGLRPASVVVKLYRNGVDTGKSLTLTKEGNWKGTFERLPEVVNGSPATYTVQEVPVKDYQSVVTGSAKDGFVVTNTYEPDYTSVRVTKVWKDEDDAEGFRPASVKVYILANGVRMKDENGNDRFVELTNDKLSDVFLNLPVLQNGREVTYTVQEEMDQATAARYTGKAPQKDGATGYVIENEHITTKITIPVTKVWSDESDAAGFRPDAIKVELYADGDYVNELILSGASDTWTATFRSDAAGNQLLKFKNGKEIEYTVKEIVDNGTKALYTIGEPVRVDKDDIAKGFTMENTYQPETIKISVTKTWDDKDNTDGFRPENDEVTVRLYADGEQVKVAELNSANGLTAAWDNLPVHANGKEIVYTLREDSVARYTTTIAPQSMSGKDGAFEVTNTYTPTDTHVTVEKIWDDESDKEGFRDAVTVVLKNDANLAEQTAVLDESNGYFHDFTGLQRIKNKQEIKYWIEELTVDGYEKADIVEISSGGSYGFEITNKRIITPVSVQVTKIWEDDNNSAGFRPPTITVRLLADYHDGKGAVVVRTRVLSESNNWSYIFTNLQQVANKQQITYSVEEVQVSRYESSIAQVQTDEADFGFAITNTHVPEKTKVEVVKVWNDEDDVAGYRPAEVKVELRANGQPTGKEETLNEGNNWAATFTDLPKYQGGHEIVYTVDEEQVAHYQAPAYKHEEATDADGNVYTKAQVTNTYTPTGTTITVRKKWTDEDDKEGFRTDSVVIKVVGTDADENVLVEETLSLDAETGWTGSFANLPLVKNGKELTYDVVEVDVPEGYTVSYHPSQNAAEIEVENTHIVKPFDIPVEKIWNDADANGTPDADGRRPKEIIVNLEKLSGEVVQSITIRADQNGDWKGVFRNVQAYERGKDGAEPIVYVVKEVKESGNITLYEASVKWNDPEEKDYAKGVTITNTYEPKPARIAVEKEWKDENDKDGFRPEEIRVALMVGSQVAKNSKGEDIPELVLNAENDWKGVFENLPAEKDGQPIDYSVREVHVKHYQTDIRKGDVFFEGEDESVAGFIITNVHTPDETPGKTVSASGEEDTVVNLLNRTDAITYKITTVIPMRDDLDAELSEYVITDTIHDALVFKTVNGVEGNVGVKVDGVKLNNNEMVGSVKVVEINGQKLTVTMPKAYLAERYQGTAKVEVTFTTNIREEIPDDVLMDLFEYTVEGNPEIPNQANARIKTPDDEWDEDTNETKVKIPDHAIVKEVDGDTKDHKTLENRDEDITYTIRTKIAEKKNLEKFEIVDELDAALVLAGADGKGDVTVSVAGAHVDAENGKITVSFEGDVLKSNMGKEVVVTFVAHLTGDEAFDFSSYKQGADGPLIPNTAKYISYVDGKDPEDKDSNEVTVTPPPSVPVKKIEDASGNLVDETTLEGRYDDINYVITVRMPVKQTADQKVTAFLIKDVLEPVLEVKNGESGIKVFIEGKGEVTGVQSIEKGTKNGAETQVVTVHFADGSEYLEPEYLGKEVTVTFTANIKEGADLSAYIKTSGRPGIDNDVSARLDIPGSKPTWSKKVTVTPGDKTPVKEVNGEEKVTVENRDDEVTYTIKTVVPERDQVESFVITDTLEPVMEITSSAGTVSVEIKDAEGKVLATVSEGITIDYSTNTLKVDVPRRFITAALKGKDLIVTFKARIRDIMPDGSEVDLTPYLYTVDEDGNEVTLDKVEIPNVAKVRVNDEPEVETNPAKIVEDDVTIEKTINNGNDPTHYTMDEWDEVLSYTITTQVPVRGNLKSFVITDELEDALAFTADEVEVKIDGKKTDASVQKVGKLLTVTLDETLLTKENLGKKVEVTFRAVVLEDADLTKYLVNKDGTKNESARIPNEAKFELTLENGEKENGTSDKVTVTPPDPDMDKTAMGENEEKIVEYGRDEEIPYTISTRVPVHSDLVSFVISDQLERVLKFTEDADGNVTGVSVTVDGNENVAGVTAVASNADKTLTVTFTTEAAQANMGKKVVVTFTAEFEPDVDLSDYIGSVTGGPDPEVPNRSKYEYRLNTPDNDPEEEWSTIPVVIPGDPGIRKEVEGGTHYDLPEDGRNEAFTYTIKSRMPEHSNVTSFVITDALDEVLELATGTGEVDVYVGTERISGAVDYTDNTLTVTFPERTFRNPYLGKEITITFKARLRADVTDEELAQAKYLDNDNNRVEIPNKASYHLVYGNEEKNNDSDEVTVTPPSPELDKETGDGKTYDTHYDMPDTTSNISYRITTAIPVNPDMISFAIEDELVEVLEFRTPEDEIAVTIGGKEVKGLAKIDGQKLTVYIDGDLAKANLGKAVEIVFEAGIREGADLKAYLSEDTDRVDIPNKATYVLTLPGDDPVTRTTEDTTTTPGDPEITKEVSNLTNTNPDKTHLYLENYNGETFIYTLKTTVPMRTNINQYLIEDILVDEMQFESGPNRAIAFDEKQHVTVELGGTKLTGVAEVKGQSLVIDIPKDTANANPGATLTVTFHASLKPYADLEKYRDPADGEIKVPNKAAYYMAYGARQSVRRTDKDYTEQETNEVYVTPIDPEQITYQVNKIWVDANNRDGVRPEAITIRLFADGTEVAGKSPVYVTAAMNWRYTFEGIDKIDWYGNEIKYSILEDPVNGYTTAYTPTAAGTDVTNTHNPELTNVNVAKNWNDANNAYNTRPAQITVRLYANGNATGQTLTLSQGNGWTGNFTNLDRYANGQLIDYTVREDAVARYTPTISRTGTYTFRITNTLTDIPPQEEDEPDVLGERRTTDTGEVLGVRRGKTGDDFDQTYHMLQIAGAALAGLLFIMSSDSVQRRKRRSRK